MMAKPNLGVDLGPAVLRAAVVRKKRRNIVTEQCRMVPVPLEVFHLFDAAGKESAGREKMVSALRELLDPIAAGEERISLSLPDVWGRLCLMEVESGFKNKEEGREFLRWRLKPMIPFPPEDAHLDYQVLKKPNSQAGLVVVSILPRRIIEGVSDLCEAAGYFPVVVDFHSLNCFNYYHSRITWVEDVSLLVVEDGVLSFFFFQQEILGYHRCRWISSNRSRVFDDIRLSIIDCEKRFPSLRRGAVYLHADSDDRQALMEGIKTLFSGPGTLLETGSKGTSPQAMETGGVSCRNLVAAVGAAFRLLRTS